MKTKLFGVNIILKTILLVFAVQVMHGQQDAQYTQYMYNTLSINPAYAGSRGHISVAALHRSQWVGLDGAPTTQTFNIHTPISYKGVGLGLSIVNDEIGPTSESNFDIDFSYTIHTSKQGRLSFGLKAGANLLNIRFSELNQFTTDPLLENNIDNRFSPNFGAGVYYRTHNYYLGFSVPRFLETTHFEESSLSTAREQMNFYFMAGYVWEFTPFMRFKPTLLTKVVQGAPLQVDLSANALFHDKLVLGLAYRLDAAVSALAGFYIGEGTFVGLAYDREITELGNAAFNDGSFEVIFRYDFINSKGKLKSPRFF